MTLSFFLTLFLKYVIFCGERSVVQPVASQKPWLLSKAIQFLSNKSPSFGARETFGKVLCLRFQIVTQQVPDRPRHWASKTKAEGDSQTHLTSTYGLHTHLH